MAIFHVFILMPDFNACLFKFSQLELVLGEWAGSPDAE